METTRTYLNMETEIRNNILIITIDKLVDDISLLWHIKIVHNHKVLYESGYCKEDRFEYSIEESGKYLIFYQAKLNSKVLLHERDAIWYYTESQYDEFENFSVEIQKDGTYEIVCKGRNAKGNIEFEIQ